MINITEKAAVKIKEMADEENIGYYIVRAKQIGGGCNGMITDIFFDDIINDTDEVFEFDGVKIVVDMVSFQYLDNSLINYEETDFGGGFKVTNPNIKSSCGCGKSSSY
jgi:iron-sulfur cluster insertion protein